MFFLIHTVWLVFVATFRVGIIVCLGWIMITASTTAIDAVEKYFDDLSPTGIASKLENAAWKQFHNAKDGLSKIDYSMLTQDLEGSLAAGVSKFRSRTSNFKVSDIAAVMKSGVSVNYSDYGAKTRQVQHSPYRF